MQDFASEEERQRVLGRFMDQANGIEESPTNLPNVAELAAGQSLILSQGQSIQMDRGPSIIVHQASGNDGNEERKQQPQQ